ncbi:putative ABC transporter permease [Floccifex sp.]|uniref:putative ABC transporter permease n=1 Tax=Floccifex sp. TaxID=2815810 RepID=UPI002A7495D4|nr:putative ABC transporter permease [Floccifex sp.]MDY2957711.1 putative ABC transporter permease [Floccifex sp.]
MKNNKTKIETKSLELLNAVISQQEHQEDLYIQMAKQEIGENIPNLNNQINDELDSLNRGIENINVALKTTEEMKDELKARNKDIKGNLPSNTEIDYVESISNHFAKGINLYKILLIMIIGSFLGVIIEMMFCFVKYGYIESRTCTVIGPFNIVYGLGAIFLSVFLYKYRNRGNGLSFVGGFIVGSVVEYLCSYFQELMFGSTSWDYSAMPFNLNGRICLMYSVFWGILGVLWIKDIYPLMSKWILKIPNKIGKIFTIAMTVFLIFDYCLSGVVVFRWMNRQQGNVSENKIEETIDEIYPDEKMEKIYPNLVFKK